MFHSPVVVSPFQHCSIKISSFYKDNGFLRNSWIATLGGGGGKGGKLMVVTGEKRLSLPYTEVVLDR